MTFFTVLTMRVQYEKLHAALQAIVPTYKTHCGAAASRNDTLTGHSIRGSDRRSSEHIRQFSDPAETNHVDGGWRSAYERSIQSMCPSYDIPHQARSQCTAGINTLAQPAAGDTGCDFNQADVGSVDSSFMAQSSLTQEDAWYNLSLAEAGIEQFAGFEPLSLFQQGWRILS